MRPSTHGPIRGYRYSVKGWEAQEQQVIEEASVSLTVNGEVWLSFTCTPAHLEELCVGFLFNEGVIRSRSEIQAMTTCANGANVDVWLDRQVEKPTTWQRTSGCNGGVTSTAGEARIDVPVNGTFSVTAVAEGMSQMLDAQAMYHQTRGVHCSILFDGSDLQYVAEDIGRHNTLDKLAGMALLAPKVFHPVMVFTTGRVSSEMLQKSARLGAIAVISRTSPTTLSTQFAQSLGITLIGYARRDQFQVYTHPERLEEFPGQETVNLLNEMEAQSSNASA